MKRLKDRITGFIYNGRTYVPLRSIAETLGKEVKWEGETKSIYIEQNSETVLDNSDQNSDKDM